MPDDRTVFFVTPLGDDDSRERERAEDVDAIIRPLIEESDLSLIRADQMQDPGRITSQVIRSIHEARLVVADLTGPNPNVMYEVGVADAFGKPVIVICDQPSTLPFDRAQDRAIPLSSMHFRDVPTFEAAFRRALLRAIEIAESGERVDNPVSAAAGTVALAASAPADPTAQAYQVIQSDLAALRSDVRQLSNRANQDWTTKYGVSRGVVVVADPAVGMSQDRFNTAVESLSSLLHESENITAVLWKPRGELKVELRLVGPNLGYDQYQSYAAQFGLHVAEEPVW